MTMLTKVKVQRSKKKGMIDAMQSKNKKQKDRLETIELHHSVSLITWSWIHPRSITKHKSQ
jgi:hypothetical protein